MPASLSRRSFINQSLKAGVVAGLSLPSAHSTSKSATEKIKIGIIGLDTSHAPAFTKLINTAQEDSILSEFKIVSAYPQGSTVIKSSYERIPQYIKQVKELGVEIVGSIQQLLGKVDAVLLETNDGQPRLAQTREVFKSGKPVFIDKPVAASLKDVVTIFKEASEKKVAMFSASSLRFMKNVEAVRSGEKIGKVIGADTFSPATLESHHPDLFWYGIHGVEVLFAVMGVGCESVTRTQTLDTDIVVGKWKDGRLGTFRGTRTGKHEYGGTVYGAEGNIVLGPYDGYENLVLKIADFFKTKVSPVAAKETIEIYAFMEAADESKRKGGKSVKLEDVLSEAGFM